MKNIVQGFGINDYDYPVTKKVAGARVWIDPAYRSWTNMLMRCYDKSFQDRQKEYTGSTICKEWLSFSKFREWFYQQDYEGKLLTKDMVNGNQKEYSPENCAFVDKQSRFFVSEFTNLGNNDTQGVIKTGDKFVAHCRNPKNKYKGYLGTFETECEASKAYQEKKREYAIEILKSEKDVRVKSYINSRYNLGYIL